MKRNPINGNEKYNEGHNAENKKDFATLYFLYLIFYSIQLFLKSHWFIPRIRILYIFIETNIQN